MMRSLLVFLLFSSITFNLYAQQKTTTVILVRHAEKGFDKGGDPDLTEEGVERANELLRILKDQSIDAIFSTPFKRTRQTVAPLAKAKGIKVEEYNPFKLDLIIELIKGLTGSTIVFSGHSNTVPVMLNQMLGEEKFKMLDEKSYDDIFIANFRAVGNTQVLHLNYGKPTD